MAQSLIPAECLVNCKILKNIKNLHNFRTVDCRKKITNTKLIWTFAFPQSYAQIYLTMETYDKRDFLNIILVCC